MPRLFSDKIRIVLREETPDLRHPSNIIWPSRSILRTGLLRDHYLCHRRYCWFRYHYATILDAKHAFRSARLRLVNAKQYLLFPFLGLHWYFPWFYPEAYDQDWSSYHGSYWRSFLGFRSPSTPILLGFRIGKHCHSLDPLSHRCFGYGLFINKAI